MRENNGVSLREMLEQFPTARLNEMMRLELRKETPDKSSLELILSILEERESALPVENDAQAEAAWEAYQKRIQEGVIRPKPARNWKWVWWTASAAAIVLVLLLVVPQRADAEELWEMLDQWKNGILELFNSSEKTRDVELSFEPNHPGLQQLYDEVVKAGIEDPLIPMWFEEEYDLTSCTATKNPTTHGVSAEFTAGMKKAVLNVDVYAEKPLHGYYGEETYYKKFEQAGAVYTVTRNNDLWVAIWTKDNVEYFLTIDCQENTLDRVLESIYGMGER